MGSFASAQDDLIVRSLTELCSNQRDFCLFFIDDNFNDVHDVSAVFYRGAYFDVMGRSFPPTEIHLSEVFKLEKKNNVPERFKISPSRIRKLLKEAKDRNENRYFSCLQYAHLDKGRIFSGSLHCIYHAEERRYYLLLQHLEDVDELAAHFITMSFTDFVTGLSSKRKFLSDIKETIHEPGSFLIFLDLDNFKMVNDMYGHALGDRVLRTFGEGLTKVVSSERMIPYRFGGDEFVIIARHSSKEDIEKRLMALKTYLADDHPEEYEISFSAGIVESSPFIKNPIAFIKAADSAMYKAKFNNNHIYFMNPAEAKIIIR